MLENKFWLIKKNNKRYYNKVKGINDGIWEKRIEFLEDKLNLIKIDL